MKACIYGAGALGGYLGMALARAGCSLSAVARGDTLGALQAHGLRLQSTAGVEQADVRASAEPAELGTQDLVVLSVKTPALPDVARRIAPLLGPGTMVLTAMNGLPWWFLDGFGGRWQGARLPSLIAQGDIGQAIVIERVLAAVVYVNCTREAPGFTRHNFGSRVIVGAPSETPSARADAVVALLRKGGILAKASAQIHRDVWHKLAANMPLNPISALTGATTDRVIADPLVADLFAALLAEAAAIAARLGIADSPDRSAVFGALREVGATRTSMLQDVQAGHATELDALLAVMRELGQLTGVATPFIDGLLGLARLHAQVHGLYLFPS